MYHTWSGCIVHSLYSPQWLCLHSVIYFVIQRRWKGPPCFMTEYETVPCCLCVYVRCDRAVITVNRRFQVEMCVTDKKIIELFFLQIGSCCIHCKQPPLASEAFKTKYKQPMLTMVCLCCALRHSYSSCVHRLCRYPVSPECTAVNKAYSQ